MNAKVIANRLMDLRGDMPRETVAKKCGITISALSNYENGARIPRDEIKVKLAEFYNVTVQSIFFAQ